MIIVYNIIRRTRRLTTHPKSVFFFFLCLPVPLDTQPEQYRDAYDMTRDMMMDFREKRRAAEFVFVCIRRLLAFSFLKILLEWVRLCSVSPAISRWSAIVIFVVVYCSQQSELHAQIPDGHWTRQRVRDTVLPEDRRPAEKDWQAHVAAAQEDRKEQNGRLEELQAG